ncbi:hypothetical protein A2803_00540 [Candidatus Woesebacteria bacterium RIFCSPHIGHO2_01_FULL_44_21]|uniref:Uncharacterized protein n=1 Tax=Candidatus Woesebacteria bacterium RIFCSPHIGHO2_01_FULL_44_21 TaxID=1802503 RepID=A0A1F7YWA9_9BACT|nr:MAG: hypothetical protein A2803_00540 [Candidatus Woesebacteria bacterium RIFCSPHIGHO2_01_FULL_44_21]OGM68961.1 MAG: hypothetical protein A2897_02315 [Candidatus Woesebacteria bacterium RIFCSPLOWO2_01_FULL_44_24b]
MPRVEQGEVARMGALPYQRYEVVDLRDYCADCPDGFGFEPDAAGEFIEFKASEARHVNNFYERLWKREEAIQQKAVSEGTAI